MPSSLERYRNDLDSLILKGDLLHNSIQSECFPEVAEKQLTKQLHDKRRAKKYLRKLPVFAEAYQRWYSETKALIRQLLPDRLADLTRHYEKPKARKEVTFANYTIEDYLQGLRVTRRSGETEEKIVGPDAAIPQFRQQLAILKSAAARFESSLLDIRQLVRADLFDSELDAAEELAKKKFTRAAGALAGVVLERHLAQVCDNHGIRLAKKTPTISDLNNALKTASVLDIPEWRHIQLLADIRNLCDHNKKTEPTPQQVGELVFGVKKVTKSLF